MGGVHSFEQFLLRAMKHSAEDFETMYSFLEPYYVKENHKNTHKEILYDALSTLEFLESNKKSMGQYQQKFERKMKIGATTKEANEFTKHSLLKQNKPQVSEL